MSRRSESRWDNRDRQHESRQYNNYKRRETHVQKTAVSDEDAIKALLFSAEKQPQEREGTDNKFSRQSRGNIKDGDSSRGRSSRWGDEGKGGKKTINEISYYGPGGNTNDRSSDGTFDRKRKRPQDRDMERGFNDFSKQGGRNNHRVDDIHHRVEDDNDEGKSRKKGSDQGNAAEEEKPQPECKPNFGLSGALAKDTETGNVYKGAVLKFKEPPEARAPNTQWRFYVFKPKGGDAKGTDDNDLIETLHVSKQSAYLFGRNTDIADIPLLHPSLSSQHAVLQYRAVPVPSDKIGAPPRSSCQPYIMDLESTNGTTLNGVRIDSARYYQLKRGDVLTFGASTREYILLTENTTEL